MCYSVVSPEIVIFTACGIDYQLSNVPCPVFLSVSPLSNHFVLSHGNRRALGEHFSNLTNYSFAFFPLVKAAYQTIASLISIQEEVGLISFASLDC